MCKRYFLLLYCFVFVVVGGSGRARGAISIAGDNLFAASTGEIVATFIGSSAGYTDLLFLDPLTGAANVIFNNQTTTPGTVKSLGFFTAGTELIFRIDVTNTGDSFFSGPGSRNSDGIVHAAVDTAYPGGTYVGFEDLYGGGDHDYNDIEYSFSGLTTTSPVPEATSLAVWSLFGLTIGGVTWWRRRKSAA